MVRTQIQLAEAQAEALRRLATERGVSMSALIREAVDRLIAEGSDMDAKWQRALAVVGKYKDKEGATDVAVEHDRYFVDAYFDRG